MENEEKTEEKLLTPTEFLVEYRRLEAEGKINAYYSFAYCWLNRGYWAGRFKEADEMLTAAAEMDLDKTALTPLVGYSRCAYNEDPKRLQGWMKLIKAKKEVLKKAWPDLYLASGECPEDQIAAE